MNDLMNIGLEVHIELATPTKLFCPCEARFGAAPNTLCCPVCAGFPGSLPTVNLSAVELAVRAGLALGCQITPTLRFDRKHYNYPDLPRGYQISQFFEPLCTGGGLTIETPGGEKYIPIKEMHVEDDAGRIIELPDGGRGVDLNRCGTPLLELVTEPVMENGEEASAFLEALMGVLRYCAVSNCRIQEGSMRADMNLSVRPGPVSPLGQRTETKNIGSLRELRRAAQYEAKRQEGLLRRGEKISPETRRWDEQRGQTVFQRPKERPADYRYIPEPDLLPIPIGSDLIEAQRALIPELPAQRRKRWRERWNISPGDSVILSEDRRTAEFFEAAVSHGADPVEAAKLITTGVRCLENETKLPLSDSALTPQNFAALLALQAEGRVNRAGAREVLAHLYQNDVDPGAYARSRGFVQITDEALIEAAVAAAVLENPEQTAQYRSGKTKVRAFLMGRAMTKLGGRADPALLSAALDRAL